MSSSAVRVHSDVMIDKLVQFGRSGRSIASKEGQILVKELKLYVRANPTYANYVMGELSKLYVQKINLLCEQYERDLPIPEVLH